MSVTDTDTPPLTALRSKDLLGSGRHAGWQLPKPRQLPLGELTAVRLNQSLRLVQGVLPIEVVEHFPVPERLPGLPAHRLPPEDRNGSASACRA